MKLFFKREYLFIVLGLIFSGLSFQNCSKVGSKGILIQDMKAVSATSASQPDGARVDDRGMVVDDYTVAHVGVCAVFAGMEMPIPESTAAAEDVTISNRAGDINIPAALDVVLSATSGHISIGSAREVDIQDTSGHILVRSAQAVQIHRGSGQVQVSANVISSISERSGALCLNAVTIGKLSNLSGGTKVIASEVDEISHFSGNIHIYGAKVNRISDGSGNICLHDGATVLSVGSISGSVGECN